MSTRNGVIFCNRCDVAEDIILVNARATLRSCWTRSRSATRPTRGGTRTNDAQLFPKFISILGRSSSGISKEKQKKSKRDTHVDEERDTARRRADDDKGVTAVKQTAACQPREKKDDEASERETEPSELGESSSNESGLRTNSTCM